MNKDGEAEGRGEDAGDAIGQREDQLAARDEVRRDEKVRDGHRHAPLQPEPRERVVDESPVRPARRDESVRRGGKARDGEQLSRERVPPSEATQTNFSSKSFLP